MAWSVLECKSGGRVGLVSGCEIIQRLNSRRILHETGQREVELDWDAGEGLRSAELAMRTVAQFTSRPAWNSPEKGEHSSRPQRRIRLSWFGMRVQRGGGSGGRFKIIQGCNSRFVQCGPAQRKV